MSSTSKCDQKHCITPISDGTRDSFSRFDQKLCQKLLSHISISDCFRFECVSKHWKTVLYSTRNKLIVCDKDYEHCRETFDRPLMFEYETYKDGKETNVFYDCYNINNDALQRVLKKCSNIDELVVAYLDDYVIDVISNNCKQLKSLKVISEYNTITANKLRKFGENCGKTLERIDLGYITIEEMKILMPLLVNIRSIDKWDIESCFYLYFECFKGECMPKLEEIHSEVIVNKYFVHFAEIYCAQMKRMTIRLTNSGGDSDSSFETYKLLANFTKLESLQCNCGYIKNEQFRTIVKLIKKCCTNLKSFSLVDVTFRNAFFNFRDGFESLRMLRLNGEKCGNFEYLKDCVSLTHLCIHQRSFNRKRLKNIHINVPNLTNVELSSDIRITNDILFCLTRLRKLREIKVTCFSLKKSKIKNKHLMSFIEKCGAIRKIWFHCLTIFDKEKLDQYLTKNGRKISITFYN